MTTLIILSIILFLFVAIGFLILSDVDVLSTKQKTFVAIVYTAYLVFALLLTITMVTVGKRIGEKELLDRPNSYKKEYTYKQIDGKFIIIDSTYIKK